MNLIGQFFWVANWESMNFRLTFNFRHDSIKKKGQKFQTQKYGISVYLGPKNLDKQPYTLELGVPCAPGITT